MYSNLHIYRESETAVTSFPHVSSGVQVVGGNPLSPLFAHVHIKAAATASSTSTVTVNVVHSDDNSTWAVCTSGAAFTFTMTSTAKELVRSIEFMSTKPYTAIQITVSGGTDPTLKYNAFQALERLV
jgi:hypothetical protein